MKKDGCPPKHIMVDGQCKSFDSLGIDSLEERMDEIYSKFLDKNNVDRDELDDLLDFHHEIELRCYIQGL